MSKSEAKKSEKSLKKAKYSHPGAKFNFRRHVLPPLLGILIMLGVAGFMNGEWITAQVMYHFAKPTVETSIVSSVQLDPKAPTKLSIASIKVDAPVINVPSSKESDILHGLREGVVQLQTGADFGQPGNVVLFGHSSGQPLAPGKYKFVFTLLNKAQVGQRVVVDYKGTRYIYQIKSTEIVLPTDVGVLNQTKGHDLTLITCSPVGSNTHRLIVHAEQISPKPNKDEVAAPTASTTPANLTTIPDATKGNESIWQSIRNLF